MAQYTFTAGDDGSTVLGGLNDNFTELYTDKIEADTTVALTNKTIDGDLNTVQDLPYTAIKSTARTGLDVKIVTGTAGDDGELMKWNSDGDAVTTDVSITTTAPTSASADTTVPTSQAVYDSIVAYGNQTKQIFVPFIKTADTAPYTPAVLGAFAFAQLDSAETGYLQFHVPPNFNSLTSVELIMIPDATETLTITTLTVQISASDETYNNHATTASSLTKSVTVDKMTKWDLMNVTGTPFAPMTANDMVGVLITSGTTMIRALGLLIKFT